MRLGDGTARAEPTSGRRRERRPAVAGRKGSQRSPRQKQRGDWRGRAGAGLSHRGGHRGRRGLERGGIPAGNWQRWSRPQAARWSGATASAGRQVHPLWYLGRGKAEELKEAKAETQLHHAGGR